MKLAELFGTELPRDCSKERARMGLKVEIILKNGERRYFKCHSSRNETALEEIIPYVESIQKSLKQTVFWRFEGNKTYHMGKNFTAETKNSSFISKPNGIKEKILDFFGLGLEEITEEKY